MSHNVALSGIKITDLSILADAVQELASEGVNLRFRNEPCEIRGYGGAKTKVDAAIMCPENQYDIGLRRAADGSYSPILEDMFRMNGVTSDQGALTVEGEACRYNPNTTILGKLNQLYTTIQLERNASMAGHVASRVKDVATGQIHLTITS